MMKKALVLVAVMAIASTAMAVPSLATLPKTIITNTGTTTPTGVLPTSITPDGAYIGGTAGAGFAGSGIGVGFVYNVATGVSAQPVAGGFNNSVNGIGYQYTSDGHTKLVIGGDNGGWQSMNTYDLTANGGAWSGSTAWTKVRRGTYAYGGGSNTVTGSGGPMVYGTFFTPSSGTPNLYIDAITDGNAWASAPDTKGTSTSSVINGVSSTGVAVGYRQVSGVNNSYVLTFDGDGGLGNAYVSGLAGNNQGELYDIADNGTYAGGRSPVSDGRTGTWPYVRNMSTGAVYELPHLGTTFSASANGLVYGMSPDGQYAVGMDYTLGHEMAVLWDLRDINNIQELDLTQYAIDNGILDGFTGNLRRAYSMGINGAGELVIAGVGYNSANEASGWSGFVMTIPEPTTVLFLAIGGLALLRRRH